jgi:5-methyltetrahydropteroyltriglutamate--homocysteine methyltransferase
VERYWSGAADRSELLATAAGLRRSDLAALVAAELDSVPVNTFSYYDHMLDTAVLLGAVPERFAGIDDDLDRYFAMARGTADVEPLEMTKWFDTNYHYLVPELGPDGTFGLHPDKVLDELAEALELGVPARPVLIGPVTFLLLAKHTESTESTDGGTGSGSGTDDPLSRIDELVPLYAELLDRLHDAGADWVQFDEPTLVQDRTAQELAVVERVYSALAAVARRPAILVAGYFGEFGAALAPLVRSGIDGLAIDLVAGAVPAPAPGSADLLLVAGVVDGRNVWRTDPTVALTKLGSVLGSARAVAVSTSCSLLHVPYSLESEGRLDAELRSWLAFADDKVAEVVTLARALIAPEAMAGLDSAREAVRRRLADPTAHNEQVRRRVASLPPEAFARGALDARQHLQAQRYPLPALPTTTIGSFPQTAGLRRARQDVGAGRLDQAGYEKAMRSEIATVIALQEDLGLDVLVHGEPERNDMVQYFAEQLTGYATTDQGWVQSYGSRCVRPPILFGDVARVSPMTVSWSRYAQGLTDRPVKGMLTGPVTMLAWSFVRDDQPLEQTAYQVALAIRDEMADLEGAGLGIIQVDEPALRELLPLRSAEQAEYLRWAVAAFRLATSGVGPATAVHTHLCYSEFGEILSAIADLDADVTSVEAARSHMELVDDLTDAGYRNGIGPGVYDIHSPRIPEEEEIIRRLRAALAAVSADRLWVNPDCGLKTRRTEEVVPSLRAMVDAARHLREELLPT